jgi:hypothetical protein
MRPSKSEGITLLHLGVCQSHWQCQYAIPATLTSNVISKFRFSIIIITKNNKIETNFQSTMGVDAKEMFVLTESHSYLTHAVRSLVKFRTLLSRTSFVTSVKASATRTNGSHRTIG